jgi:hypothetical protein
MGATINKQFACIKDLQRFVSNFFKFEVAYDGMEQCYRETKYGLYWNNEISIHYKDGMFNLSTKFIK